MAIRPLDLAAIGMTPAFIPCSKTMLTMFCAALGLPCAGVSLAPWPRDKGPGHGKQPG